MSILWGMAIMASAATRSFPLIQHFTSHVYPSHLDSLCLIPASFGGTLSVLDNIYAFILLPFLILSPLTLSSVSSVDLL